MSFVNSNYSMNGRTLRLGTDCSGLETICIALQLIKANVIHRWACECEPALAAYIKNHYTPERFYNNIFSCSDLANFYRLRKCFTCTDFCENELIDKFILLTFMENQ